MPDPRRLDVLARLAAGADGAEAPRLCEVAAQCTAATGAGIMLIASPNVHTTVCTTDATSSLVEELQVTLGEGPCIDAFALGRSVAEPDLAHPSSGRWTAFSSAAVAAGVRSVFGYPVGTAGSRIGAMNLYRNRVGHLSSDEHAYALVVADVAGRTLLSMQDDHPGAELTPELRPGTDLHMVVHQAAGMVSAQLGVTLDEAYVRLRARAFAEGDVLTSIAQAVVERRLQLDAGDRDP